MSEKPTITLVETTEQQAWMKEAEANRARAEAAEAALKEAREALKAERENLQLANADFETARHELEASLTSYVEGAKRIADEMKCEALKSLSFTKQESLKRWAEAILALGTEHDEKKVARVDRQR